MRSTRLLLASLVVASPAALAMDLNGMYIGHHVKPAGATDDELTIAIRQSGKEVAISTVGASSAACNYVGKLAAGAIEGDYTCTDGRAGRFALRDIELTPSGFAARLLEGQVEGRLGGARTEYAADWDVNIVPKGDTLLATLYVKDEETGLPNWYSAAPVASTELIDANGRYSGPVYESTGPYLAQRKVGKMTIELIGRTIAAVDLTIDGVELPRKVGTFF
jgi:hypothetical protein